MSLDLTDWQNKKYQTRDGQSVRLLCIDGSGECDYQPILGLDYAGNCLRWNIDGSYHSSETRASKDLINAPPEPVTITRWVNVCDNHLQHTLWEREEQAAMWATSCDHCQTVPVSITFTPNGR